MAFLFSAPLLAWDSSVMVGEWERYSREHKPKYERLVINKDFSGSYLVVTEKKQIGYTKFTKEQTIVHDGFISINLDGGLRFVISAWGELERGTSPKRLLGNIFLYHKDSKEWKLINSIPVSFYSSQDNGFVDFSHHVESIKGEIANKAPHSTPKTGAPGH
jgi:hypothetical protein